MIFLYIFNIGASVSEPHLRRSTCSLCVCLFISYVRHFWSRGGPRATRKRKPAHLKFKGHMRWRFGYVANASLAITTSVFTVKMALPKCQHRSFLTPLRLTQTLQNRRKALPIQPPLVCVALLECDVAAVQSATLLTLAP